MKKTVRYCANEETQNEESKTVLKREIEFPNSDKIYKLLSLELLSTLKDINIKLISNLFDTSGKVILPKNTLTKIVMYICDTTEEKIIINTTIEETKCLNKIAKSYDIQHIMVNGENFFSNNYNNQRNILMNLNISLLKCLPDDINFLK